MPLQARDFTVDRIRALSGTASLRGNGAVESRTGISSWKLPMATHSDALSRQWLMLQWIPRYPLKVTSRELASRLASEGHDATKRTVERDLLALSSAFPLACDDRSKPFGWSWQRDAPSFSVPGMSPLQAMVLNLARNHLQPMLPAHLLDPLRPYFRQADATLRNALGKRGLAAWSQRVAVVQPTQPLLPPKVDQKVVAVVHEALARERQLEVRYRSRSAEREVTYRVHPLGLVYRGIVGYLVCTIADYTDLRSLALHRIHGARILDDVARIPKGFDLDAYAHSGAFGFRDEGPVKLELRMTKDAAEHLHETPLSEDQVILEDGRKGWVRVTATVHDTSQLRWWLLGFGSQIQVLKPSELSTFIEMAKRILK